MLMCPGAGQPGGQVRTCGQSLPCTCGPGHRVRGQHCREEAGWVDTELGSGPGVFEGPLEITRSRLSCHSRVQEKDAYLCLLTVGTLSGMQKSGLCWAA